MSLLTLFLSFVQVGLFSVGGGYAAVPLIKTQVVDTYSWLTMNEFSNLLTIAEMTPGPIAVNAATFVGLRIAGIIGAIVATVGCILPSLFLVTALAMIYRKYHQLSSIQTILGTMRPAVTAVIASAFISIFLNAVMPGTAIDYVSIVLFALCFVTVRYLKKSPIVSMFVFGAIYAAINMIII